MYNKLPIVAFKIAICCIPMLMFLIEIVTEIALRGRADDLELSRDSLIL